MRCTVYSAESRARKKVAHKISLFIHADTVDFLGREAYNNTNRTRHASRVATAHDADHVGSFFIPGVFLMQPRKQHQPALPIGKQIENLKRLGLSFEDEDSAGDFLRDVSYFRLVKAYSLNLKNANGTYIDGVTFDGLKNLYLFDSKLRHLLIPLLERVEVNLRCRLSDYFCVKYGVLAYDDPDLFRDRAHHKEFTASVARILSRQNNPPFVQNFTSNYENGKLPFYALVEVLSFSDLSKFYKNMLNDDRRDFSTTYYGIKPSFFASWIWHLAIVRNVCAHYGRLYNVSYTIRPRLYNQYADEHVDNSKLFATFLCLKHLLPQGPHWETFVDVLEELLVKYPNIDPFLLGFPDCWKSLLLAADKADFMRADPK